MKDNITKNITLGSSEKVVKHFMKMNAIGYSAQIMLTTRRLIFFTKGIVTSRGKKVSRKLMNEIELKSIHRIEYYEETLKLPTMLRLLGLLLFVGVAYLVYLYYFHVLVIPAYPYQAFYTDYAIFGVGWIIALMLMFHSTRTLYLRVKSGAEENTTLKFTANKYNELALRYLAGKVHNA